MIGSDDPQNLFAVIAGVVVVAIGVIDLINRRSIAVFKAGLQAQAGALGARVAQSSKPWVYAMVGIVAIVLGLGLAIAGLFVHFNPPGTPR